MGNLAKAVNSTSVTKAARWAMICRPSIWGATDMRSGLLLEVTTVVPCLMMVAPSVGAEIRTANWARDHLRSESATSLMKWETYCFLLTWAQIAQQWEFTQAVRTVVQC